MDLTIVYDCKGSNLGKFPVPPGVLLAGYATGTGDVPWTAAQWAAHPNAVRIDQWPSQTSSGETADLIDVENGAVTIAEIRGRVEVNRNTWRDGTRPGQRWPAVYVEESELTPVANQLSTPAIMQNVPLFLTKPMTQSAAIDRLNSTGGPFPLVGIQYEFHDTYDVSVVSTAWLDNVSGKAPAPAPDTRYTVQLEHYQDGFGWVLDGHLMTPPATRYRARVSNGEWSQWQEFRP